MPVRSSWPVPRATRAINRICGSGLTVLVSTILVQPTSAQFLDLDRPAPPILSEPNAIDYAVQELFDENRQLSRRLEVPTRVAAQIAVRKLAADLLGADYPDAHLWGFTIEARLDVIDGMLLDEQVPEAVCILLLEDLNIPAFDLPGETGPLDRFLRDTFAELAMHAGNPSSFGWVTEQAPTTTLQEFLDALSAWEAAQIVQPASARELREILTSAESWPAYASSARALRERIQSAAALLDALDSLDETPAQVARNRFGRAVADLLAPELRDRGVRECAELAQLATMLTQATGIEDRVARSAVVQMVEQVLVPDAMSESSPDFSLAQTILGLLVERSTMPREDAIVRSLRPGYRALSAAARETEVNLAQVLPQALGGGSAMADPAVLAPLGMHRNSLDDLRIVLLVNELVQDTDASAREPVVRDDRRMLASRLLKLGKSLADSDEADIATQTLRELGGQARTLARLQGSAALLSALDRQTARDLAEEIDKSSLAWMEAWSESREDEVVDVLQTLERYADLYQHVEDLSLLSDQPLALHAWPAFELSPELSTIVINQAPDLLEQTAQVLIDGNLSRAAERLESYQDENRVLTLLAHIERGLRARGLSRDASVADLVSGTPAEHAWRADMRDALAEISLLLMEIEAARERNEPRTERDIRRYANYLAEHALEITASDSP